MEIVNFEDFSFKYDNVNEPTLKHINLKIHKGEKVLIAGPSGSGKSTLAHCINGLIPFTFKGESTGKLFIGGLDTAENDIYQINRCVGTIMQDQDSQFVGLNVGEDVAFAYENNLVDLRQMKEGVNRALAAVGMLDEINETPYNLSGGQKQKVSVAGILANDTELLLLDEPLANLDPASSKMILDTIDSIHRTQGRTVIIIEHRIEDVLEYGVDRVIVMNDGMIVAEGTPDKLLCSDAFRQNGLREPLYVEILKKSGAVITEGDHITDMGNAKKFKPLVLKAAGDYKQPTVRKEKSVLSIRNVSFRYYKDAPPALDQVSFDVMDKEILAVLGNNGAGKSTLLSAVCGMIRPQSGSIEYRGNIINGWSVKKRADVIGYVMQNPNHMITKNMIYDEVAFGLRNRDAAGDKIDQSVREALKICGLSEYIRWPVSALSYGQKKRLTIASILALKPSVILLDEPTAGQDYRSYREFMSYVRGITEQGISIVIITHNMQLALEYADRAVVISGGKVIEDGTVYKALSDKTVLEQADLSETSISELGRLYQVENHEAFLRYFVNTLRGESDE